MQCFGDRPMVSLYGTMSGAISEVIANPNPGALLVKDIKAELRQRGIAVGDSVINVARGEEIIDFESDMLRNILRTLLLKSDNMYTESVLRAIAIKQGGGHSMEDGVEAVKKYWCGRGLQTGALFMYDGSGLSRNDRCTASFMTQILRAVEADSAKIGLKMSTLRTRLGEDGNIGNGKAVKRSAARGKIASKSGSMVDVQCYAGYYPYDEPRYAWAILVNNFSMTRNALKERIDRLLARLFSE